VLARMICVPVPRSWSGVTPLTDPAVPTGMNAGVCTAPWGVVNTPRRADPAVAVTSKRNTPLMLNDAAQTRNGPRRDPCRSLVAARLWYIAGVGDAGIK